MDPATGERRRNDRRSGDRRVGGRRRDDPPESSGVDGGRAAESLFDPGWLAAGDIAADDRLLLRRVRRAVAAQGSALVRVFRTYVAARAAIGVGLVVAQGAGALLGIRLSDWMGLVCLGYAAQAITLWLLPRFDPLSMTVPSPQRRHPWVATIGVDLVAFSLMHLIEVGGSFNYAALLVLPVLMAGALTARVMALGAAAAASLVLLLAAWRAGYGDAQLTGMMLQSGLGGLGFFFIALLAGELAVRLAREELAARGSLEVARQQAQLNRLVIEEMADGVLVVDRRLRVRAANPAARALLTEQGLAPPAPFDLGERPVWHDLAADVDSAFARGEWPEAGTEAALVFENGYARTLRLRVRFMRSRALEAHDAGDGDTPDEHFVVLLLEDARTVQARVRQEKLAAMGRISAGIAHEIRNPLAAIAQANALLLEDELSPGQQRLARIVADNVERLKRLVADVMEVAPGAAPAAGAIDARATVAAAAAEWAATARIALGADGRVRIEGPSQPLAVVFDSEHLRRVLVNLLDNATRHAGAGPGAIVVQLHERDEQWAQLSVASDGEPIAADVERHLFEPFFSTRSRGNGLGLYICRELCERYGGSIEYRARPASERLRNAFVVTMRRAAPADAAGALPLEGRSP